MVKDELGYRRRELMFRIIDGRNDYHPITMRLHFINEHFPPNLIDEALEWLVVNGHTGLKFVAWFKMECGESDLQMHEKLLRVIKNAPVGSIVAGRNFRL